MPIFELACKDCKGTQEVLQKVKYTEEELLEVVCNKCEKIGSLSYIVSAGGFTIDWW